MAKRHSGRDIPRLGTGRFCFDPTLYLVVNRNGARSWVQRIHVHTHRRQNVVVPEHDPNRPEDYAPRDRGG